MATLLYAVFYLQRWRGRSLSIVASFFISLLMATSATLSKSECLSELHDQHVDQQSLHSHRSSPPYELISILLPAPAYHHASRSGHLHDLVHQQATNPEGSKNKKRTDSYAEFKNEDQNDATWSFVCFTHVNLTQSTWTNQATDCQKWCLPLSFLPLSLWFESQDPVPCCAM